MALHRLRVTIAEYGHDEAFAERFLEAFVSTHPEVGAVVSQDTQAGTLTVVFSLDASDANDAFDEARVIFLESARATKLKPTKVLEVNVSLVEAPEAEPTRDLQPV